MLDEEINKRINEAAEQYHPAYDDEAWNRMEKMLNEHLPQKKKSRKIFYFLFLTTILTGGLLFIFYPPQKNIHSPLSFQISNDTSKKNPQKLELKSINLTTNKNMATESGVDKVALADQQKIWISVLSNNTKEENVLSAKKNGDRPGNKNIIEEISNENKAAKENPPEYQGTTKTQDYGNEVSETVLNENNKNKTETATKDTLKDEQSAVTEKSKPKSPIRTSKTFNSKWGLTFSAGPDVSGLSIQKAGKLTIGYGAGLRFDFSPKFTLRSGFYVSSKIYDVGANDYHAPLSGQFNYTYLQHIGADCRVYEIPLILNFNFAAVKNHRWFVATGLSSYLMKKESYIYYYKYPTGNAYDKYLSIRNQNKHYFSVLDLSGGYEYDINKRFSVAVEPYVKLPLSGVGAGKIKLNSAGILFSLTMNPFKR